MNKEFLAVAHQPRWLLLSDAPRTALLPELAPDLPRTTYPHKHPCYLQVVAPTTTGIQDDPGLYDTQRHVCRMHLYAHNEAQPSLA